MFDKMCLSLHDRGMQLKVNKLNIIVVIVVIVVMVFMVFITRYQTTDEAFAETKAIPLSERIWDYPKENTITK